MLMFMSLSQGSSLTSTGSTDAPNESIRSAKTNFRSTTKENLVQHLNIFSILTAIQKMHKINKHLFYITRKNVK